MELCCDCSYLDVLICHANVVGICLQILWSGHDGELYRPLVSEGLVSPLADRANFLNSCNAVIGNENLRNGSLAGFYWRSKHGAAHVGDDGVSIVIGDEILD